MPDYFRGLRRTRAVGEYIRSSVDPSCNTV